MKKQIYVFLLASTSALINDLVLADVSLPHEFKSGEPAYAAEVNENFEALRSVAQDNQQRIDDNDTAITQNITTASENKTAIDSVKSQANSNTQKINTNANAIDALTDLTNYGSQSMPGQSCREILIRGKSNGDGQYWIDPLKSGTAIQVYCDMTTDGGGWTIVHAVTGADGEEPLVSDTEVSGDPLFFQHFNLSRQKKADIAAVSSESLFVRSTGVWLKVDKALFDNFLLTDNRHRHYRNVNIVANDGSDNIGIMGWSNFNIASGGDFALNVGSNIDHHSTNYYHLNSSCDSQLIYSYSGTAQDGDAGYDVNTTLGSWTQTLACDGAEGGNLSFRTAMR